MNIPNLNKLIAHLEAQPPERINMAWGIVTQNKCGTCGCIAGHARLVWPDTHNLMMSASRVLVSSLGVTDRVGKLLAYPLGFRADALGTIRYPAHRVIATLKRLRDTYLSTGQVVVDWGSEPGEEPKQAWTAPQVAEVIAPALPAELTSLLRPTVEA